MPYREDVELPHEEAVELYHNAFSGCSSKVRMCLAEAGVAFRSHHIHLIETGWYQTSSPAFKRINPAATVPVLLHKGHPVYESSDQIEYIDRVLAARSGSLVPAAHKAEVQSWVDFTSVVCPHDFGPADMSARAGCCLPGISLALFAAMIREIPFVEILWGLRHNPNKIRPILFSLLKLCGPWLLVYFTKTRQICIDSRDHLRAHLLRMDALLGSDGRPFLCGEAFTLADVSVATIFERLDTGGFHPLYTDLPHVSAYWARLKQRPSYTAAFSDAELPIVCRGRAQVEAWKRERPRWAAMVFTPRPLAEGGQPAGGAARAAVVGCAMVLLALSLRAVLFVR